MKAFSRTNKRKQGSQASGPVLITESEHEVSSSTMSDKLVNKKTCTNNGHAFSSVPPSPSPENAQPIPTGQVLIAEVKKAKEVISELESLREDFRKLSLEKEKAVGDLADLKKEKYEKGFEKAVDQVKFLHPEINVAEVGAFKEIRDGKLVDIPDEE
ncbi:hypothetical protein SESBI_32650 [Sesbania bispinosa]|nr:hypothetical protein SESBI_32650 [Sesbania bispinosa]